jgi:predicted DNA-binding protein (MmcQ/YjbR family)
VDVGEERQAHTPFCKDAGRACAFSARLFVMKAGKRAIDRLMKLALGYPEAWEDHPWEDTVVKVRKKIFVFVGMYDGKLSLTVKLPESRDFALSNEWATPSGYGLGRAGWVTVQITSGSDVPIDLFEEWVDESYRAIAPKTLVKQLDP